ncbi:MAG: UTP--glucose-1-phosphate uridylyltransferase [Pirellulales bacterium]|nr:UTP--glucose-1-phosphate uridylyltransferase [Pirellulales bacterium]
MTVVNKSDVAAKLPANQQHLLRFWDELDDAGRQRLADQLSKIDFELIDSLYRNKVDQPDWAELSRRAEPPAAVRLAERASGGATPLGCTPQQARQRGVEALRAGQVGVLITAGGQGSRLGFDKPKSLFPIGPISKASLLQIHIEKVRAIAARYGRQTPLYLMTSPVTHADTLAFLKENNNFGLAEDDLFVFCQGTMPAVDAKTGALLMEAKDSLFLSPDGHGGTVAALEKSGAIADMNRRGVKQLFYLQVDNPLAPIGDPELIGYHLLAGSELTSLAVAKQSPHDKLGNFALIDGRLHVIEYSDIPDDVAERRNPPSSKGATDAGRGRDAFATGDTPLSVALPVAKESRPLSPSEEMGELVFWAGSVAIHVFEASFLERALRLKDSLPFHVARKKAEYIDDNGRLVEPAEPNALKFERFIFDLLPHAQRPIVIEYAEQEAFAPLKNAPGEAKDTPQYVQRFMLAQHRRWLEDAGAEVSPGIDVEISPLLAFDAEGVAQRVPAGQRFEKTQYLTPPAS